MENCNSCGNCRKIEIEPDSFKYHPCEDCRPDDFKIWHEEKLITDMAKLMMKSMMPLIEKCVEQRLKQFLPLIKEGFRNDKN